VFSIRWNVPHAPNTLFRGDSQNGGICVEPNRTDGMPFPLIKSQKWPEVQVSERAGPNELHRR
jgi:hypothetical protein